jgi:hypothetical protein
MAVQKIWHTRIASSRKHFRVLVQPPIHQAKQLLWWRGFRTFAMAAVYSSAAVPSSELNAATGAPHQTSVGSQWYDAPSNHSTTWSHCPSLERNPKQDLKEETALGKGNWLEKRWHGRTIQPRTRLSEPRRSNQPACCPGAAQTSGHVKKTEIAQEFVFKNNCLLARPERFELPTLRFEV